MFEVFEGDPFSLDFEEKEFFISQLKHVSSIINNSLKIIYKEDKIKGFFLITMPNEETFHIAFYILSPKMEEEKIVKVISEFLDFLEKIAKEKGVKYIFGGVDYYNDEIFELFVEKGYSAVSYKMRKKIE